MVGSSFCHTIWWLEPVSILAQVQSFWLVARQRIKLRGDLESPLHHRLFGILGDSLAREGVIWLPQLAVDCNLKASQVLLWSWIGAALRLTEQTSRCPAVRVATFLIFTF